MVQTLIIINVGVSLCFRYGWNQWSGWISQNDSHIHVQCTRRLKDEVCFPQQDIPPTLLLLCCYQQWSLLTIGSCVGWPCFVSCQSSDINSGL